MCQHACTCMCVCMYVCMHVCKHVLQDLRVPTRMHSLRSRIKKHKWLRTIDADAHLARTAHSETRKKMKTGFSRTRSVRLVKDVTTHIYAHSRIHNGRNAHTGPAPACVGQTARGASTVGAQRGRGLQVQQTLPAPRRENQPGCREGHARTTMPFLCRFHANTSLELWRQRFA